MPADSSKANRARARQLPPALQRVNQRPRAWSMVASSIPSWRRRCSPAPAIRGVNSRSIQARSAAAVKCSVPRMGHERTMARSAIACSTTCIVGGCGAVVGGGGKRSAITQRARADNPVPAQRRRRHHLAWGGETLRVNLLAVQTRREQGRGTGNSIGVIVAGGMSTRAHTAKTGYAPSLRFKWIGQIAAQSRAAVAARAYFFLSP